MATGQKKLIQGDKSAILLVFTNSSTSFFALYINSFPPFHFQIVSRGCMKCGFFYAFRCTLLIRTENVVKTTADPLQREQFLIYSPCETLLRSYLRSWGQARCCKKEKGEKDRIRSLHWRFGIYKMQSDRRDFSFNQDVRLPPHRETELYNGSDVNELQRESRAAGLTDRALTNTSKRSEISHFLSV